MSTVTPTQSPTSILGGLVALGVRSFAVKQRAGHVGEHTSLRIDIAKYFTQCTAAAFGEVRRPPCSQCLSYSSGVTTDAVPERRRETGLKG